MVDVFLIKILRCLALKAVFVFSPLPRWVIYSSCYFGCSYGVQGYPSYLPHLYCCSLLLFGDFWIDDFGSALQLSAVRLYCFSFRGFVFLDHLDAAVRLLDAAVRLLDAAVRLLDAAVRLLDAAVQLLDATVQLLDAAVQLLVAAVQLLDAAVQLLVAAVRLLDAAVQLLDAAV